jgi:cell division protein FtsZ
MDSIIGDALKYANQKGLPEQQAKEFTPAKIRIAVVGVGGAGTNTVSRLYRLGIKSAETIAINTDAKHLQIIEADKKLLIGHALTKGLGAGGFPEIGARAAEQSREKLAEVLDGIELLFLTAGMGGGTGTGAAPVIAEIAKQQGAIVVSMVSFPFALERARLDKADWGLDALRNISDTVVIIDNNKLVSFCPNLPMNQAFAVADTLIAKAVKGISDTIMFPSLVNIDFADVKSIVTNSGVAMIAVGEGQGSGKVQQAVESTLTHPLLDVNYAGAKGALIHIAGGPNLTLGEVTKIGEGITNAFDSRANVMWGARINPDLQDKVIVTAILTGVQSDQVIGKLPEKKAQKMVGIEQVGF